MFNIGDPIFHSVHGLGVIQAIEDRQIQGRVTRFSIVDFGGLTVMVNLERTEGVIRPPITPGQAEQVLEYLGQPYVPREVPMNPGQLHQGHLASLRSGDPYRICDIVRTLAASAKGRKLTPQQQDLMCGARALLVQELAYACEQDADGLERRIDERLAVT